MRGLGGRKVRRDIRAFAVQYSAIAIFAMLSPAVAQAADASNAKRATAAQLISATARYRALPEALVRFGDTTAREDRQLQRALAHYDASGDAERIEPLTDFLHDRPDLAWAPSLWLNIGLLRYRQGYFSEAITAWRQAWNSGKAETAPELKIIADRAVGELIRMHARLGHSEEVKALLAEVDGRPILGSASEAVQGAREGLWLMENEPGVAYLCGPSALRSVFELDRSGGRDKLDLLASARSGLKGFHLTDVGALARQAGMDLIPAKRAGGSDIPVPSVVHWRVNHYAAIVGEKDGRYHVKDPTFGDDLWLSAAAINAETSGYFLVPVERLGHDWLAVKAEEGRLIHGMGATTTMNTRATRPYDDKQCCGNHGNQDTRGMPSYAIHSMLVSLNIQDTPLGYTPPKGPAVAFQLTYNQREAYQPTTFTFSNVGQKWTHNWISYVTDDPVTAGVDVSLYLAGGGLESYGSYNSGTGAFGDERTRGVRLIRTSGSPITYELWYPDGSVAIYSESDGAAVAPRRVFLKRILDPAGNELALAYDGSLRLTSVTDEIGQVTTLTYGDMGNPLRLTRVTDPFGRYTDIGYDGSGRLDEITDVIGMTSTFTYDGANFITGMTTPYGTTSFAYSGSGMTRWLEVTDPLNKTERLETKHSASGIASSDPTWTVPSGLGLTNNYLEYRNTFYWDKDAYALYPTDYTKATLKHWLHERSISTMTAPILESVRVPGEERVWFTYPGQLYSNETGDLGVPSGVARVVNGGGTTQITRYEYGAQNLLTKVTDSVGREHTLTYDTNGIDLLNVKRKNGGSYETLAAFTWNSTQHLPLTITDDAGQVTTNTYNAAGQLLTSTNPLSQVTTYVYDTDGYLQQVENANSEVQQSFTYDSYGRVETVTDSEGYVLTYDYDALDRVTRVTYPDTTYEEVTYDKLDIVQSRDREGKITEYTYDAMRRLTQVDEPLPRTLTMQWSDAGRRIALFDGENNQTQWAYDIAGRLTTETYADSTQKTYGYDVAGRLSTITDALGQIKTIGYTLDDRPSGFTYTNEVNTTADVTFSYDAVHPRMTQMVDGIGTTTWAYGAIGAVGAQQVIREDGPRANYDVVAYTYDALGRRASRRHGATYSGGSLSGGETETYTYDSLGRLDQKSNALGDLNYTYLGETGQLTKRVVANGGSSSKPTILLSYDTNANDRRLTQIRWAKVQNPTSASDRIQDYNYQRDVLNRLTRIEELTYNNAGTVTTTRIYDTVHDDADRLESSAAGTGSSGGTPTFDYTYDDADNRGVSVLNGVTQTPTHNSLNQIATLNSTTYTYDSNGNLLTDGDYTYTWDAENRLKSATESGGAGRTYAYAYDGLNRRLGMTRSGTGALNHGYVWCDERICQARLSGGTGGLVDGVTLFDDGIKVSAGTGIYLYDQLGSVRYLWGRKTTAGAVAASFNFGPYGEEVSTSGPVTGFIMPAFRYADMFRDESGLYLTWNRAYNSKTGRWLNRDPIGVAGGVNLYGYVGGDVLGEVDPLGLSELVLFNRDVKSKYVDGADRFHSPKGVYTVAGHGDSHRMKDADNNDLRPQDVARMIMADPKFKGSEAVLLLSCETGKGDNFSFAQQLSDILGVKVVAPDNYVFFRSDGGFYLASADRSLRPIPGTTGSWKTFCPGGCPWFVPWLKSLAH